MSAINLRSRHLNNAGVGLNALTVEAYATDANGLPTGAAVASTTTDVNGVWKFLVAVGLVHGTRYCIKVINGSEVQWLDGSDMIQAEELAIRTRLLLPNGAVIDAVGGGIPNLALGVDVARANLLVNGGFEICQRTGPFTANAAYTMDRWQLILVGDTASITQITSTIGSRGKSLQAVYTHGGGGYIQLVQRLENYLGYSGKTVSFSVKVKSSVAGTVNLTILDGAGNAVVGDFNVGTGEETLTGTLALSAASTYLDVKVVISGTSCTVEINDAMLCISPGAVDYVPEDPFTAMARCQRYYEIITRAAAVPDLPSYGVLGVGMAFSTTIFCIAFKYSRKAVSPTVTVSAAATWDVQYAASHANPFSVAAGTPSLVGVVIQATMASAVLTAGNACTLRVDGDDSATITVEANP